MHLKNQQIDLTDKEYLKKRNSYSVRTKLVNKSLEKLSMSANERRWWFKVLQDIRTKSSDYSCNWEDFINF
jgi:hypothetical protein